MSAQCIRELNDQFRTTFQGGRVMMTAGVDALAPDVKAMAIRRVATFSEFTLDNDPHGEHDFGSFELSGQKFFFKLDYYDPTMTYGSDDPANPSKTTRVLTIMLADELLIPLPRPCAGLSFFGFVHMVSFELCRSHSRHTMIRLLDHHRRNATETGKPHQA
jgi:hypothetical protein